MRTALQLAGWYGIGDRGVEVTADAGRQGVLVRAYLPAEDFAALGEIAERLLSWDEIEAAGDDAMDLLRRVGVELAGQAVDAALPSKPAGVPYAR
jgi:hypothetical protein